MNPSMDDRRILAEIERSLARDDPELVSLMDALNHQFPREPDDADDHNDNGGRHDWRRKVIVALLLVALAGLILTALFTKPPPADDNQGPPAQGLAPAVAVHTQRRGPRTRTGPQANTARATPVSNHTPKEGDECVHVISHSRTSRSARTPMP
ncbi:DUF3040 domain-containing protein [Streptomyces sp. PSKA30]|uniref:DUF3040 domain-containing protein n=1 Tax=Streptomyces sp. PSKA30 TaxID=2874597 RepID=UPI001CD10A0E|nr:DUF3040 domain-containing protein [Streptomyces sp. PSKA30]MBZ9643127.1 DUF3040 domain-containing protein [Streptomyces sp. PSKA30]